jgi:hypothetical protein
MTRHTTFSFGEEMEMLAVIADLPDPERYAWLLPPHALHALANAVQGRNGQFKLRDGVRDMAAGDLLFRAGLVEAGGPYLSNFAMFVRKHAIVLLAEREFGE